MPVLAADPRGIAMPGGKAVIDHPGEVLRFPSDPFIAIHCGPPLFCGLGAPLTAAPGGRRRRDHRWSAAWRRPASHRSLPGRRFQLIHCLTRLSLNLLSVSATGSWCFGTSAGTDDLLIMLLHVLSVLPRHLDVHHPMLHQPAHEIRRNRRLRRAGGGAPGCGGQVAGTG